MIEKVKNALEEKKISYHIYYVGGKIIEKNFKFNKYENYKKEALAIAEEKARIDMLISKLKNASKEELKDIMEYIESCLG